MNTSVEVEGLRELRKSLGQMEKGLARELSKALKKSAEDQVLPTAKRLTPRKTGKLAGADKVGTRGDRVLLRNNKPYANTIYYGRKTLRRGTGPRYPSVVKGRPFLQDAVIEREPEIRRFVFREVERFIARTLPPS